MLLNKTNVACVAGILLCSCWQAKSAPTNYPPTGCPTGTDGGCAPRRITYGYYPTTWRRWPNEGPTPVKAQPDSLPTPAKKDPLPKVEADVPVAPSEEMPMFPTDNEPAAPEQSLESSLVPPFDDSAPEPPKEDSGEREFPGGEPRRPGTRDELPPGPGKVELPAPSTEDLPPTMPEEDPFKDEPEPNKTSAIRTLQLQTTQIRLEDSTNLRASGHWRTTQMSAAPAEKPTIKQLPMGENPGLVPPTDDQAVTMPQRMESNKLRASVNPLRTAVSRPREQHVVPAASWSSESQKTSDPTAVWRLNPLRTN